MFNFLSKQTATFCTKFKPTLPHKTSISTQLLTVVLITTQTKKQINEICLKFGKLIVD